MKCYFSYLLGFSLLFANAINSRSIDFLSNGDKKTNNGDKYYLIHVNNEHGEYKIFSESKNQKRQESQVFIESLVDEINTLIINNKDTYENPEILEEIQETSQLKKRKRNEKLYSYDDSNFVYPISSINNNVILYAYLSETLAKELPTHFESVVECTPDKTTSKYFHKNYKIDEILAETQWKNVTVRENADLHLSLISQGMYDKNLNDVYDNNYYYPSSAGKDVDIVFLDSSFNFDYSEFSNTDDRTVKCSGIVDNGKVSTDVSNGCDVSIFYHGEMTTVTAAGLTHGVANHANIYGVVLPTDAEGGISDSDILGGVQYIYENLIRSHRTVVNFSLGGLDEESSVYYKQLKELIDGINENGGIVVAAAGNEGLNLDRIYSYLMLPCELDNVICVGGINNSAKNIDRMYELVYFSNYGQNVTLYAPSNVKIDIIENSKVVKENVDGTSFSCPIVAGMVANIISENLDTEYTMKSMSEKLYENGKDFTIKLYSDKTGILANNGKRRIYSGAEIQPTTTTINEKIPTTITTTTIVDEYQPTTVVEEDFPTVTVIED